MPLDHYVTLGRSGLAVSPFCLGAMTFGEDWGWGSSVKESEAIMDRYLERGGNFIDTANAYTRGHSEKIIGDHLGRNPARRRRAVIATKFSSSLFPGDPNAGGSSRKGIIGQCEESLRRLQTDYIDLYWLHVWDPLTPIEETLRALDDLVSAGKVRYLGVSDTPAWKVAEAQTIARFRGWTGFVALQIEYSLLERRRSPASGAGRASWRYRSSTRSSSVRWRASSCRWRGSWGWASRHGRRCATGS
jgi:aryl-alcohol dehydrogenase-like predicted oxidoreductase